MLHLLPVLSTTEALVADKLTPTTTSGRPDGSMGGMGGMMHHSVQRNEMEFSGPFSFVLKQQDS